ncbi:MAG: chromosome segregation protein ScpA [Alphaproteobacteria bacterium BRH_c36]|nr:MAG: chromosome segregation protein ScpA [Alphaproteobacteria bacterium BRH_c36]
MIPEEPTEPEESVAASSQLDWDSPERLSLVEGDRDQLQVDVGGFEGPLDLLLALARTQKVDLANISVLALAEQYLQFIAQAQTLRLEVAGEYLVMAAWLAFLKSKLLLPRDDKSDDVASAEELAQRLAFRLMRLEAMRERAAQLMTRARFGRDVFGRGMPERVTAIRQRVWGADINDLLLAYAGSRQRTIRTVHTVRARKVWSIKQARGHLQRLIGSVVPGSWSDFDGFLREFMTVTADAEEVRTVRASSFGATLEMAREGLVELRQDGPFQPIYMRRRDGEVWEPAK